MNLKLRYAIDKARSVSMPKDNIERAVKRGTGEAEGVVFEEVTYEGYGPGGVAILVDALTDNRNRAVSEINKIFDRGGGKMGSAGCAGYLFERKGLFGIDAANIDEDTLMGIILEAGAEDLKRSGAMFDITCDPTVFNQVQEALKKNNLIPRRRDHATARRRSMWTPRPAERSWPMEPGRSRRRATCTRRPIFPRKWSREVVDGLAP